MLARGIRQNFVWMLVFTLGLAPLYAARPTTLAVDVVTLKSGRTLRGAIFDRQPKGATTLVVTRDWLEEVKTNQASSVLADNLNQQQLAWKQALERIAESLNKAAVSPELTFFLKQEQDRLKPLIGKPPVDPPRFLWIDAAADTISTVRPASADQRKLLLFSWNEGLSRVETQDVSWLTKELKAKGIKLDGPAPDLSDNLTARVQSDVEWAARLAIVEYSMADPFDFQGMGETLVRTGEGKKIDLAKILPGLLQQQVGSLLKDLLEDGRPQPKLGGTDWLKPAIREAESAKRTGFRATRLEINQASLQVTVETRFVAQFAPDKWQTVWQSSVVENGNKPRPETEARIEQDPQLKTALESLKSFGIGDTGALKQAIRVGAATMAAQQSADGEFSEFRNRYSRRLDGPPLPVSK